MENPEITEQVSSPRPTYQYEALTKEGAIRLIILRPSPDIKAQVQCTVIYKTLYECEIDTIDHYSALSYVWGDPSNPVTIQLDDSDFQVTRNLDSALRHIRNPNRDRTMWVDAICINQLDLQEKAIQVGDMWKVYRAAQHTLIYLGDATPESDLFFEKLKKSQERSFVKIEPTLCTDILERPWFTRVWILQEFAFSRDPWVYCGPLSSTWETVIQNLEFNQSLWESKLDLEVVRAMHTQRLSTLKHSFLLQIPKDTGEEFGRHKLPQIDFLEQFRSVLSQRSGFGVQDPRDMIFAHSNVAGLYQQPVEDKKLLKLFNPNYEVDHIFFFNEISKFMIYQGSDMMHRILNGAERMVQLEERGKGPASWATDWTKDNSSRLRPLDLKMPWNVEFGSDQEFLKYSSRELSEVIICFGCRLGKLKHVFPLSLEADGEILKSQDNEIFPHDTTDVWNMGRQGTKQLSNRLRALESYYQERVPGLLTLKNQYWDLASSKNRYRLLLRRMLDLLDRENYADFVQGRSFGQLDDDEWVLIPTIARPGDIACRFEAIINNPMLLRPMDVSPSTKAVDVRLNNGEADTASWPRVGDPKSSEILRTHRREHFQFVGECVVDGYPPARFSQPMLEISIGSEATRKKEEGTTQEMKEAETEIFILH